MKPSLQVNTQMFMKHKLIRHTHSGSIDFIQRSWKVGETGLKERRRKGEDSDEKIHPFQQTEIQPSDIEIIRELGVGGSSTVHLITYKEKSCALKVINLDDEKHQFKSSQCEIETLRILKSDFIVQMIQAYIRNRRIAIILEYMNCGSLENAYTKCKSFQNNSNTKPISKQSSNIQLPKVQLAPKSSLKLRIDLQNKATNSQLISKGITDLNVLSSIAYQILLGLIELSKHHICHRDLKPSNILLSITPNQEGYAKITDFGLAKILCENELCTEIIGTDRYHSPERLSYNSYDESSDIWSLGILLLETYLGEYPFQAQMDNMNEESFRKYLCEDFFTDPNSPHHQLPSDFGVFINACLQADIKQRSNALDLMQFDFVKRITSKTQSHKILGKFIEETKLTLPKISDPVSIRARKRRASVAHQFFSFSSDESPVKEMSFESSVLDFNSQFQKLSIDDIENNFEILHESLSYSDTHLDHINESYKHSLHDYHDLFHSSNLDLKQEARLDFLYLEEDIVESSSHSSRSFSASFEQDSFSFLH